MWARSCYAYFHLQGTEVEEFLRSSKEQKERKCSLQNKGISHFPPRNAIALKEFLRSSEVKECHSKLRTTKPEDFVRVTSQK